MKLVLRATFCLRLNGRRRPRAAEIVRGPPTYDPRLSTGESVAAVVAEHSQAIDEMIGLPRGARLDGEAVKTPRVRR